MKKTILAIILLITSINVFYSQTNIYPSSGNVGIGTIAPASKLHISNNGSSGQLDYNLIVQKTTVSDNDKSAVGLLFSTECCSPFGKSAIVHERTGGYGIGNLHFLNNNVIDASNPTLVNARMTISSTGNVGIGTQSPTAKLDIRGTIKSYEPIGLDSPVGSTLLINEVGAKAGTENSIYQRLWLYRDNASSSSWWTTRFHEGISVDGTHATPQNNTRTWWERDPLDNIQSWGNAAETYFTINKGNVGIGTTSPAHKLDVIGTIRSREVKVDMNGADFVFEEKYPLMPLTELEAYIKKNKHLPEIATAKEMQEQGSNLGDLNTKLLQKIEELTLYVIQQQKLITQQAKELESHKVMLAKIDQIEKTVAKMNTADEK